MKTIRLLLVAAALLIAGLWSVFAKFNGNTNLSLGMPLSACTFEVTGSAKGGWVMVALVLLLGAAVAFVGGLISAVASHMRGPAGDLPSAADGKQKVTP